MLKDTKGEIQSMLQQLRHMYFSLQVGCVILSYDICIDWTTVF